MPINILNYCSGLVFKSIQQLIWKRVGKKCWKMKNIVEILENFANCFFQNLPDPILDLLESKKNIYQFIYNMLIFITKGLKLLKFLVLSISACLIIIIMGNINIFRLRTKCFFLIWFELNCFFYKKFFNIYA